MNSTIESRVSYWESHGKKVLSPPDSSEVVAISLETFDRDGDAVYEALMPDGSAVRTTRRECQECGNVIETPTTSEVTAWRKRLTQACNHQRAVLKSVNVGGSCECGTLKVEVNDHTDSVGNTIMQSYSCAGCGASRSEQ